MERIRKRSGDIFEVSLAPYIGLYAYCRYINITKFYPESDYPDLLEIFHTFTEKPVKSVAEIESGVLLINPIYIYGGAHINKCWKRVGHITVDDTSIRLPYEKVNLDYNGTGPLTSNLDSITNWGSHIPCFSGKNGDQFNYLQIKHLEFFAISYLSIPLRIATEYFKMKGKDIRQEMELSEDDTFFANTFMPVTPYSKIPSELRGLPLPLDRVKEIYP